MRRERRDERCSRGKEEKYFSEHLMKRGVPVTVEGRKKRQKQERKERKRERKKGANTRIKKMQLKGNDGKTLRYEGEKKKELKKEKKKGKVIRNRQTQII